MDSIRVYTTTEFSRDPSWVTSFRLVFILKGELNIHIGTKENHLSVHDFTFIRPYELHGGAVPKNECKALIIDIDPVVWHEICPGAEALHFSLRIFQANDRHSAYSSFCKALAQIVYYRNLSEKSAAARIYRSVSDILAILMEDFTGGVDTERVADQTLLRIQDILQYISSNYTRKLSLEEIAGAVGFHPQYFSAYFKKQFGVSFTDYLNSYRVNKSIPLLRDTQDSILNIALTCGFNSHKSYSNAFEKYLSCTPGEFRRRLRSAEAEELEDYSGDEFDYLRRYWTRKEPEDRKAQAPRSRCVISLDGSEKEWQNTCHNVVSVGRALSCLRSDLQKQLVRARKDLDLEYVRIRDVFSDDLFVYYEDSNKTPVFSWRALDEILDFLVSADLKPFIEIGYMPGQMASKKQYAGWQYHPNVSFPKSIKLWEMLVRNFISHLLSRYGKEAVESWLFDFWTSPNLRMSNGYWNESMDRFLLFYRITYQAVKGVDPDICMGSPNYSCPSGFEEYRYFLDYAAAHHLMPDFISVHLYSCGDGLTEPKPSFMEFSVFDNNYRIPNIKPVRETLPRHLDILREIINGSSYAGLPIIIDDWNVTFFPTDFTRDTCFMGPMVVESFFRCCRKIQGMGFASLSDIHEDFFNTDHLFNGGPGLLTYNGIPKSSYFALGIAYCFSRRILKQGDNYVVAKTDSGYDILVYNMQYYRDDYAGNDPSVISFTNRYNVFAAVPDLDCHIELPAPAGSWQIIRCEISREHGSSYDTWVRMGSPADMSPAIVQYLSQVSNPKVQFETIQTAGGIILDETIEPHTVMYIKISSTL